MAINEVGGAKFVIKAVFDDSKLKDAAKEIAKDVKRAEKAWRGFGDSMKRAERMQASFSDRWKSGFNRGVLTSVARGENAFYRLGNAVSVASQAFDKIRNPAELSALQFQKLQRRGMVLQSTLGVLTGTIGSLGGGLLSLVGVAGQAAGSMYAIVGAMSSFVVGAVVAKVALGGVGKAVGQLWNGQEQYNQSLRDAKREFRDLRFQAEELALSEEEAAITLEKARETLARVQDLPPDNRTRREAELAYKQAELNYRKVKTAAQDANADIKRGNSARLTQIDPFKDLTASQKTFAKYLLTTRSALRQLKETAAGAFLPGLQKAIENIVANVLPTLNAGFKEVGDGLSVFVIRLSNAFQTPKNLENLRKFFIISKNNLELFGKAAASGFGAMLSLLTKLGPVTQQLGKWLDKYFKNLDTYFSSSAFDKFLKTSQMVATELGKTFKNVFTGISNTMKASFPASGDGGGNMVLAWLNKITEGFRNFTGSKDFENWLRGATDNAATALSTVGQFLRIFLDLAADPATKEFWTILRGAVDPVRSMLKAGLTAGPAFARMLVAVTKLIEVFASDSGAITMFFDTLTAIITPIARVLKVMQPLIHLVSTGHGFFLAIGLAIVTFNKILEVLGGTFSLASKAMGDLVGKVTKFGYGTKAALKPQTTFIKALREGIAANQKLSESTEKASKSIKATKINVESASSGYVKLQKSITSVNTSLGSKFGSAADKAKKKAVDLARTLKNAGNVMVTTLARATLPGYAVQRATKPAVSRRQRNRAMMADVASGGSMPMSTVSNREMEAEQAAANARIGIRQRMLNAMERMDLEKSVKFNALQTKYFAHQDKLYAEGYVYKRGMMWKPFYEYKVFLKSQLAADMQYYARRAKANIMNPTWLTGPIKRAAKASADYTVQAVREGKYRVYIAKEETKEYLAGVGRKIAKEAQWFAYRTKANIANPTWIKNEVSSFLNGVKQKIAGQNIFDVKRRASALEQVRSSATNLKYTIRESKAYEAVGNAADKAKGKLAGLAAAARARFGGGSGGAAAPAGPQTGRAFVTDQMATMRAGNMPSAGNPFAASPANSQIASSIAGTTKTVAQQKAMESSYTKWWSQQLTLRNRIKTQLNRRGLAEEGQSLGVRLTNVARSYALEGAAISAVKRTQLRARISEIAAETKEHVAASATRLKYDAIYQAGKARRSIAGLGTTISNYRAEVKEAISAAAYKAKYDIIYQAGKARRGIAGLRRSAANYRAEVKEAISAAAYKAKYDIIYQAGRMKRNLAAAASFAKTAFKPSTYIDPIKNIANKTGNSLKSMWGGVKFASLDAAKRSRMSWLASTGASITQLKALERELNKVKSMADLKSSTKVQGLTQGYGGFRGTMGRLGGKFGGAGMGIGMGAAMLGPQTATPGVGTFLSGVGGMASMIPGVGGLVGAGVGVVGAIVSGFEKAAEEEKARKKAEEEKIIQLKAKVANITAEKMGDARTGIDILMTDFGKTFAQAGETLNAFTTQVGDRAKDPEKLFAAFAPFLKGTAEQNAKITEKLITGTRTLVATKAFANQEDASAKLASVMQEGFQGLTGEAALAKYLAGFKKTTDPETKKSLGTGGLVVPTNADGTAITGSTTYLTGQEMAARRAAAAEKKRLEDLVTASKGVYKKPTGGARMGVTRYSAETIAGLNQFSGKKYTEYSQFGSAAAGFQKDLKAYRESLQREISKVATIATGAVKSNVLGSGAGERMGLASLMNKADKGAAAKPTVVLPATMVAAQTKQTVTGTDNLKVNQNMLISAYAQEQHLGNMVKLMKNPKDKTVTPFDAQAYVKGINAGTGPYLPYNNASVNSLFSGTSG